MLLAIVLVFFGGAVGSMWRYWWSGLIAQRFGQTFPFGTLTVNVVGSILIGIFAGLVTQVSNGMIAAALLQLLGDRSLRRVNHFFIIQPANV
jgi:fluoride ion exporter CrcB/FEX